MTTTAPLIKIYEVGDYDGQVSRAADLLMQGGIVVLPTETVYGAAALLGDASARERLRALPPALAGKPLIVHLDRAEGASRFLGEISSLGKRMMRKLWPGPVGLMFEVPAERQEQAAKELGVEIHDIYEGPTITLRCPDHPATSDVLRMAGGPVVMRRTPAESGQSSPAATSAEPWLDKVDLVVDAGPAKYHNKPSTLIRVRGERYEIVRSGVYDQRIIERLLRTTVLFVCSGNTCRSPMAEAIARSLIATRLGVSENELEKHGVAVMSAGTFAMPGARAAGPAIEAVEAMGMDLTKHRSRPLTVELINQADVIFTMSQSHAMGVRAIVPSAAEKVKTLDPHGDIEDPIGGDLALYSELAGQLRKLIEARLDQLTLP